MSVPKIRSVLFEDERYLHRIYCTNLGGKPHKGICEYDKRADVENPVGEAKCDGLDGIPLAKFKTNYIYFQIVMLAYNFWRYLKMIAQLGYCKNSNFKKIL
ncbi:MAG: hypothetical protein PVH85_33475, partial [Desulfobacterales bacterium]